MFTGIVTDIGEITALTPTAQGQLHRLRILCSYDLAGIADGASIASNGICMTVVGKGEAGAKTWYEVDAGAETLALTTAKHWGVGTRLNLERALKIGDELGGHIVTGHVDGIATVTAREELPDMARFTLETTPELARFIAPKGSVTLDGEELLTLPTWQRAQRGLFLGMQYPIEVPGVLDGGVWASAARTLAEMAEGSRFFFADPTEYEPKAAAKNLNAETRPALEAGGHLRVGHEDWAGDGPAPERCLLCVGGRHVRVGSLHVLYGGDALGADRFSARRRTLQIPSAGHRVGGV